MKSSFIFGIRRWLILARGKFSPPRTERANRVMRRVFFSLPLRYVPSLWNLLLFPLILLAVPACKQPTAPDPKPEFSFTIEDASCTEAWLSVKTANFGSGFSFAMNRNDSTIWRFAALPPDTIIVDEGLLPNKEYTYELLAISSKTAPVSAGKKKVTTMDTTSHNFTWQTWEFGDIGSSVLYDVAIIDENNIWAVGEISIRDSSHNGYTTYNAVHWDGVKWELKRIPFEGCGGVLYPPIYALFTFNANDIWFTRGGTVCHYNGSKFKNYCELNPLLTGSIKKLWGTSSSDIYAVGELGNIAHWDGVSWKKIESGTDLDIFSITGSGNINSSQNIVGIAGSWQTGVSVIIQIDPKQLKVVQKTDKPFLLESGTIIKNRKYYFGGAGIFTSYNINSEFKLLEGHPNYFTHSIFAKDYNDVYGSRSFGVISHYNGYTWYHRTQYSINGMMPRYSIIRSYGDNVVAAGQVSNPNGININAAITIGKRN